MTEVVLHQMQSSAVTRLRRIDPVIRDKMARPFVDPPELA